MSLRILEGVHWLYLSAEWFVMDRRPALKTRLEIQINYQLVATISPVYYLTFIYSSTCFGRPHAHHQKLDNCSSSLWFYLQSVVIAVLRT